MENIPKASTYRSVDELARELGISRGSAYKALRAGQIPHIRIGKRYVIPKPAVMEWMRSCAGRTIPGIKE